MNSKYTAEVHFSKYSYHKCNYYPKDDDATWEHKYCTIFYIVRHFYSACDETWIENQNIGSLQPKVIFHVTSIYISIFKKDCLANDTTVRKRKCSLI